MADNEVLRATTEIKIHELRRHDGELSTQYDVIDAALEHARGVAVERLRTLFSGVEKLQVVQERLHKDLEDLPDLLDFGAVDPNSVGGIVGLRTESIEREVKCRRVLWQHNKLLGALLMETFDDNHKSKGVESTPLDVLDHDGDWLVDEATSASTSPAAPDPLEVQRRDAQKRIKDYFFVPCGRDRQSIRSFLETEVFHRRERYTDDQWTVISKTLRDVREAVVKFCGSFTKKPILATNVAQLAKVLLVDKNEFSSDVVQLMENAAQNVVVQQELAHVLTIKLSTLSDFQWPSNGVPVVMKRAMNGRFRSLMQEGAIPFLLFQYIGLSCSIFIKPHLAKVLKSIDFERDAYSMYRGWLMNLQPGAEITATWRTNCI